MATQRDLRQALVEDVEQIEQNSLLFADGKLAAYQTVAAQLRTLLADARTGPLLERVFPDVELHKLEPWPGKERPLPAGTILASTPRALTISIGSGTTGYLRTTSSLIPLTEWLDQELLEAAPAQGAKRYTIRQFVFSVANTEVVHTEDRVGGPISGANTFQVFSRAPQPDIHRVLIVALGDYVARRARELLAPDDSSGAC